jgi:hypothetical protein
VVGLQKTIPGIFPIEGENFTSFTVHALQQPQIACFILCEEVFENLFGFEFKKWLASRRKGDKRRQAVCGTRHRNSRESQTLSKKSGRFEIPSPA